MTLRVALVGGPMYDRMYDVFADLDVEVVVHADHPTLNQRVADLLAAGERIDVLATHSKYAPSQAQWLLPLDDLLPASAIHELAPLAVDLCRFEGRLLSVPRLIDVRVLWARRDVVASRLGDADTLDTWQSLVDSELVVGFPGRESGLFGTFFELVVGNGGALFHPDGRPNLASDHALQAIHTLAALARRAPADLPDWHYDQVDQALLDGRVDAAGAWPGAWAAIRAVNEANTLGGPLVPLPYPAGSQRRVSYSGCHSWAIPTTCGDVDAAAALVARLCSAEWHAIDATGGTMCANTVALGGVTPADDIDGQRLRITAATIAEAMITYPPHPRLPVLEDAGWRLIRDVLVGQRSAEAAVREMQQVAEEAFVADPT